MPRGRPLAQVAAAVALAITPVDVDGDDDPPRSRASAGALRQSLPAQVLARVQTVSPAMLEVLVRLVRVAPANAPLVLVGATGTGKSLLAEVAHGLSGRQGPFLARSARHLDGAIVESRLFGHVRGAFTDAREDRPGYLTLAAGGTFVLDDVQCLPLDTQYRLLDVLQQRVYWPVGARRPLPLQCRIVVTADRGLGALMQNGLLHPHLRWRLGDTTLRVPSLTERREDIPLLASHLLADCSRMGIPGPSAIGKDALALLVVGLWEGNVRELEGVLQAAYQTARSDDATIRAEHLPDRLRHPLTWRHRGDLQQNLRAIATTLALSGGRVDLAAKALGVARSTLYHALTRMDRLAGVESDASDSSRSYWTRQLVARRTASAWSSETQGETPT